MEVHKHAVFVRLGQADTKRAVDMQGAFWNSVRWFSLSGGICGMLIWLANPSMKIKEQGLEKDVKAETYHISRKVIERIGIQAWQGTTHAAAEQGTERLKFWKEA